MATPHWQKGAGAICVLMKMKQGRKHFVGLVERGDTVLVLGGSLGRTNQFAPLGEPYKHFVDRLMLDGYEIQTRNPALHAKHSNENQ